MTPKFKPHRSPGPVQTVWEGAGGAEQSQLWEEGSGPHSSEGPISAAPSRAEGMTWAQGAQLGSRSGLTPLPAVGIQVLTLPA